MLEMLDVYITRIPRMLEETLFYELLNFVEPGHRAEILGTPGKAEQTRKLFTLLLKQYVQSLHTRQDQKGLTTARVSRFPESLFEEGFSLVPVKG